MQNIKVFRIKKINIDNFGYLFKKNFDPKRLSVFIILDLHIVLYIKLFIGEKCIIEIYKFIRKN